ncbi:MAG: RseA family anti-sigma factor [Arenicellales bacterium]|nr:RseA family anti-sigma factor [Arenicellales bacterium]
MREKISALLDDELDSAEQEEVLRSISRDESLSNTWQRYHLIRAAVRNESIAHIPGFSERLSTVLLEDTNNVTQLPQPKTSLKKWVPGLALAASVAGLVAFSFFTLQPTQNNPQPAKLAQIDQATKWETTTPDQEQVLNAFLVEHGEFTPMSSMNGLMAYAKFVSYDSSE